MKWDVDFYDKIINEGNYDEIIYKLNEGNVIVNIPPHKRHKTCLLNSKKYDYNKDKNVIINKESFDYYYYKDKINKIDKNKKYEGLDYVDRNRIYNKINKIKEPKIKKEIEEEKDYNDINYKKKKEYYTKMIGENVMDNIEDLSKENYEKKNEENKNEELDELNNKILHSKIKGNYNYPGFIICKKHSKLPFNVQSQDPKLYKQGTLKSNIIPAGKSTRSSPLNLFSE